MNFDAFSPKDVGDPYAVLNLDRKANEGEIKRAYFKMVRQHPPEQEPEKFQEIRKAYEQLRDPERRASLDLFLLQSPPELPNRRRPTYDLKVHPEDLVSLTLDMVEIPMQQDFREIS